MTLQNFRYRGVFASSKTQMEFQVRSPGAKNANELLENLPLFLNPDNHFWVALGLSDEGYGIRATAPPPFRTHSTGECDYDAVYEGLKGSQGMIDVYPTIRYVLDIFEKVQTATAEAQAKLHQEQEGPTGRFPLSFRVMLTSTLRLAPTVPLEMSDMGPRGSEPGNW